MSSAIPDGWSKNTIDECCEILDSQRVPINSEERAKRKGDYPYYGANGVQGYIDDYIFEGDSILLAEDGGNFDQYADRPIAQWVTGKFWVNNHAHILRAKDNATDKWIFYSLVHKNILKNINGGTRAKLNQSDLKEIEILLSPLPEQKKIASILTSVDEVIENTQKQIDKLQDLKKATMNELLTKGIGHTEFKDSELGRIPKSWEVVNFQELIHSSNQGVNTTTEKVTYSDNGTKACRSNNIQENYFDWSDEKFVDQDTYARLSEKVKPQMNDVLYCNIGSNLGASTVVMVSEPFMVTWNVLRITPNHRVIMPHFLCYSLNSARQKLRDFATESTMPFISSKALSKFKFRIPPISEQEKISIAIDTIYSLIEFQKQKLSQTQSLKKSLMQDLLTGKVRVTVN